MPPAAIYCRISDDKRGDELGVKRQERQCRELCERLGWPVERVYIDDDRSAYDPAGDRALLSTLTGGDHRSTRRRRTANKVRPAYNELLAAVRGGDIGAVVAWHPDRLHRSPLENEAFIALVEETRIKVHTVQTGDYDLSTPDGRMLARMHGSIARRESEHRSARVRAKMDELAERGAPMRGGGRPFGYDDDRLTIRESEAAIVREAAQRVLAGESLRGICADFERRGIERVEAGAWVVSALRRTLLSPRIAGLRQHPRTGTHPAQWPGIIDIATHERLKAILTHPDRKRQRPPTSYLLSGLVVCGHEHCGARLIARPRADKTRRYDCPKGPGYAGCGAMSCVAEGLEDFVTAAVLRYLDSPELARAVKRRQTPKAALEDQAVVAELAELERKRADLGAMWSRSEIDSAGWRSAKQTLDDRERSLRAQLRKASPVENLDRYRGTRQRPGILHETWPDLTFDQQRTVITAVVDHVALAPAVRGRAFFDPDRVSITWKA